MAKRFVVECIWSGYRESQRRTCHRRVISEKMAERLKEINTVSFTDQTTMSVKVRECVPREKVKEIRGYDQLLDDFLRHGMKGWCSVNALQRKEEPAEVTA